MRAPVWSSGGTLTGMTLGGGLTFCCSVYLQWTLTSQTVHRLLYLPGAQWQQHLAFSGHALRWYGEPQALHCSAPGTASAGVPRPRRLTWACMAPSCCCAALLPRCIDCSAGLQVWNQQTLPSHDCQGAAEALWGTLHIWSALWKYCLKLCVAHESFQLTPRPCLQSKGTDFCASHPGLSNTSLCKFAICEATSFKGRPCHP